MNDMNIKNDVKNKVALITGANRGIGESIVDAFFDHGVAKVYAAVRDLNLAKTLQQKYGDRVVPVYLDLEKPETIDAAADVAKDVQIVVNNAGVLRNSNPLADDAIESLDYEMRINVLGLMRMAKAFAPGLKQNGGGAFVQLNSVASLKCFVDFATYSASKAAAYSITQGLREQLGSQGTAVLSVHPGPIATDMANSAGFMEMAEPPSVVAEGIVSALKNGDFHVFPDSMAQQVGQAYQTFAENVIEAEVDEE